ncbi:hypothetical protein Rmet_6738 (plasmid) [Cupriavidus metallidurans CH34]|uniref:Uncharacterized protein n=1 Tax=Cupriavidus metallidurans (strain ATCC 43123 / DSM 2839 / NBRC 102507 / CH34) TaxID=266264 RepID=D3DYE7_CUPMC|nr:hypothetical protein Rmet_6738 [Cupriavidus metallidurans CH34]
MLEKPYRGITPKRVDDGSVALSFLEQSTAQRLVGQPHRSSKLRLGREMRDIPLNKAFSNLDS